MISIHQNSFTNPNVKGAQSFFYEKSEKSKKLGLILQNHLNKKINTEKEKAAKARHAAEKEKGRPEKAEDERDFK